MIQAVRRIEYRKYPSGEGDRKCELQFPSTTSSLLFLSPSLLSSVQDLEKKGYIQTYCRHCTPSRTQLEKNIYSEKVGIIMT